MGFFSPPSPPAYVPPATEDNAEVEEAKRLAREAERRRRGRVSTILTSGQGVPDKASSARKTLLGE